MNVAITSEGNTLNSIVDPRFGRCAYFAIYDTETKKTEFIYKAVLDKWLTEHEYLHVYKWFFDNEPNLNREEAMDYRWISPNDLKIDIQKNKHYYTAWFYKIVNEHFDELFWE